MEDISKLVDLIDKEDFVEFGKKFEKLDPHRKRDAANEIYRRFDPVKASEKFFDLESSEVNKLALTVAAKATASRLKTTQIRKILNMSNNIYRKAKRKTDISADVAKLRYILAYAAARHKNEILPIAEVVDKIIPKLNAENYERFHDFLQALVAYHRFLGGRE
ncbi:CRISPR type III-A/MTUBE-associated protein Csm2 [Archaeoglobus fulgidus DSM 8774]|uniref:CRISPR system Cms protein Csm2 n=1 Tax=Archaeoglobus fulgidus DSM 8774 TaxID=1344584 RepID=A0A075WE60_ARCFL|nr:type III-A CRISPR-associated protein Csm2 [Archaeoglobus fulgidus]AIG97429.1 CRISPR type III-A/MTUBE-associated protein Csm2 [Archaeoglobus fulgidus DSM 8774]